MNRCHEVTLAEMLSDPIVQMVMKADGVDPHEFESNLRHANEEREARGDEPGESASACCAC